MRFLFVPVSAPRGIGEYARAREIAMAIAQRWPRADIHFVLSRMAPYAAEAPFPVTLLPSSATFHSKEVAQLIRKFRPTVVLFDNAGRTAQLKAARESGARIVYVSSRPRQRYKAFRVKWMRLIDEHWIACPEFVAGPLTGVERLKLHVLGRPVVRYLDTIMPETETAEAVAAVARFELQPEKYVLVVPGGGTAHPGAERAPQIIAEAAERLATQGHPTLLIGANAAVRAPGLTLLRHAPRVAMAELVVLLRAARLIIANGGDTLVQALACARPCVATPIAHDQARRIARCEAAGVVVGSRLDARELERAALSLLGDERRRSLQLSRIAQQGITNGIGTAMQAISSLARASNTT